LRRFVEAVKPSEEVLRRLYYEQWQNAPGEKLSWEEFVRIEREQQPLSFHMLVPEPPDEELRELEEHVPCTMCGAHGTLPRSEWEARARGARWLPWMAERNGGACNVCSGSGLKRVSEPGWYTWRIENWGTKWDAHFGDPFLVIRTEGSTDVEKCVEAKGATITPTVAIYKFDTAWSPPIPVVEAASERYPELEFTLTFGEPGAGYAGRVLCLAGLCVEDEELELEDVLAPEEMWF
jgi:hypothetical protein